MIQIPDHPDIRAAERTGYAYGKEPKGYLTCDWCGGEIYLGTDYYEIQGETICSECVDECRMECGDDG